jgi:hypothetical protein
MKKKLLLIAIAVALILLAGCLVKPVEVERAFLDNILINENPLPGFQPDILQYNHGLPNGEGVPLITPVKRNETDIVKISYPDEIPGAAAISVRPKVAQGTDYLTTVYIIVFSN